MKNHGYRDYLRRELDSRKARNSAYSMRAFALYLGVSKTALADALAGRRHLSKRALSTIGSRLEVSADQAKQWAAEARGLQTAELDHVDYTQLTPDNFSLISEWYYLALLNLARVRGCRNDAEWVANRLQISVLDARIAIERLAEKGYLAKEGRYLRRRVPSLQSQRDIPSATVRRYHQKNLSLASHSLDRDPMERREFCTITMATTKEKLEAAKKMIQRFHTRLGSFLESDDPTEVYTLAVQLFPVARKESK